LGSGNPSVVLAMLAAPADEAVAALVHIVIAVIATPILSDSSRRSGDARGR
jgi:hypothetical protein